MSIGSILDSLNGTSSQSSGNLLEDKLNNLSNTRQNKLISMGMNTDADSGPGWRLQGADAPEVFHNDPATRNKVYMQYALANNVDIDKAKEQVDAEALAYKISKDNGYDLGKQIEEARQTGAMDADYQPTSFDLYRLGDRAKEFTDRYQALNPDKGILSSTNEGKVDPYGRALVNNNTFVNEAIKQGYMVPGELTPEQYQSQTELLKQARRDRAGLNDSQVNRDLMDAIHNSSYSTLRNTPQYETDSSLSSALGSSLGSAAASLGDVVIDFANTNARNIYKMAHYDMYGGKSDTQRENEYTQAAQANLKKLGLDKQFDTELGRLNFSGLDEAKKRAYWGYEQSQELKGIQDNLSNAWKSKDPIQMVGALGNVFTEPTAIAELLAGSAGEIALGATGIGTAGLITSKANDFIEARTKITGKPATGDDILIGATGGLVYGLVNKLTKGNAGIDVIKNSAKSLTDNMTEVGLISLGSTLKDIAVNGTKAYGLEGTEEVIQTIAEQVSTKLGTEKSKELFGDNMNAELFTAFGLGGASATALETSIDAPRKLYDMRKNNKPLNEIITTANNLSSEDRGLVLDELNLTKDKVQAELKINKDMVKDLTDLVNSDTTDYSSASTIVMSAIPKVKTNITNKVSTELSNLLSTTDNDTKNITNSVFDLAIQSLSKKSSDNLDASNSVNILSSLKTILNSDNIDMNEVNQVTSKIISDPYVKKQIDLIMTAINNNLSNIDSSIKLSTVNDIFNSEITKENIQKTIDSINKSSKAMNKDLGIIDFKQKEFDKASSTNPTELINRDIAQDFNAKTLIESGKLNSLFSGLKNASSELNKYSTETLQKLEEDAKVNASKVKNVNKLRSVITTILRTRAQAEKSEGFKSTKTATDIFKEYTGKGADTTSSLLKAVRVPSMSAQEATVFKGIVEQLRADEKISETASNNLINRINKISDVIIPTNNTEQTTTQDEPAQPTSETFDDMPGTVLKEPINNLNDANKPQSDFEKIQNKVKNNFTVKTLLYLNDFTAKERQILKDEGIPITTFEHKGKQRYGYRKIDILSPKSKENTQEISDSIQTDMTLEGLELQSTDPEVIKQALELSGIIQTMCK